MVPIARTLAMTKVLLPLPLIESQLLCSDDGSPLAGTEAALGCLKHLLEYHDLPAMVELELRAALLALNSAKGHVEMAARWGASLAERDANLHHSLTCR
jgi:hypothetical protein